MLLQSEWRKVWPHGRIDYCHLSRQDCQGLGPRRCSRPTNNTFRHETLPVNTAIDRGEFRSENTQAALGCLSHWDEIFEVLPKQTGDHPTQSFATADQESAQASAGNDGMGPAEIEAKIQERTTARRQRNFALADRIRDELSDAGILIEDTKDGMRWKRK